MHRHVTRLFFLARYGIPPSSVCFRMKNIKYKKRKHNFFFPEKDFRFDLFVGLSRFQIGFQIGKSGIQAPTWERPDLLMIQFTANCLSCRFHLLPTYIHPGTAISSLFPLFLSRFAAALLPPQSFFQNGKKLTLRERSESELGQVRRKKFISYRLDPLESRDSWRIPPSLSPFGINPRLPLSSARSDWTFLTLVPHHLVPVFAFASLFLLCRLYGFRPPKSLLLASAPAGPGRIQTAFA